MKAFFDDVFLERYMKERVPAMLKGLDLGKSIQEMVAKPEFDVTLKNALEDVASKPEGAMLNMMKGRRGFFLSCIVPLLLHDARRMYMFFVLLWLSCY